VREIEVQEDSRDDGWIGEECEDPHLATAGRTEKRQYAIDPCEEYGPANAGRVGRPGWTLPDRPSPNGATRIRAVGFSLSDLDLRPADSNDGCAEAGIWGEYSMIPMSVQARWGDEV